MSTYHAYHGTKADFEEFMYEYIGNTGVEHGYGFYFTDRKDIADSYGNYVIEADLEINNPLSNDDITITKRQLSTYIYNYIDPVGDDWLSNFGWYEDEGYSSVLSNAVNSIFSYANSDVDIIGEVFACLGCGASLTREMFEGIKEVFGRDGIIYSGYDTISGESVINYIVFSNSQIKNKKKLQR